MKHPRRATTRAIRSRQAKRVSGVAEREPLAWPETAVRVEDASCRHVPPGDDGGDGCEGHAAPVGIVSDRNLRQAVLESAPAKAAASHRAREGRGGADRG